MEERLRSHYESLSRAIGFTKSADAKAAPVIALQVALAGTLAARMEGLWLILTRPSFGTEATWVAVLLVIYAVLLTASIAFAANVYIPRHPRTGRSLIYLEDIASIPLESFSERARQMDPDAIEQQLIDQVHAVSGMARIKIHRVRWAYFAGSPSVVLWVVFLAWGSIP